MKLWLTTKWGAVKPVIDTCLRMIKKLPNPNDHTDLAALTVQSHAIHKQVADLIHLEEDVEISNIEGQVYLELFLSELKKYYR
jgi:hypothetical protein